jgi:hypothetical protein
LKKCLKTKFPKTHVLDPQSYGTEFRLELLNKCGSGSYAGPEFPSSICSTFFHGSGHLGMDLDIWEQIRTLRNRSAHLGMDLDQGCGSGFSNFVDPDPGARKLRNFRGKMHFLVILKKNFTT